MDVEIIKSRVEVKPRRLRVNWTIDSVSLWHPLPSNQLIPVEAEASGVEYAYGVDCRDVMFPCLLEIEQWVNDTFNRDEYLLAGPHKEFIWFSKEKHRTLLMLKWS